ncbi:CoA pyrophosphatase [Pseudorhodoplanes sp.]|uniref:CoA pyrophosphatase n=1 Tax=Pseudorhodoplanes sp. TaxID=1934341 RepID=UPI00391B813A
MTETALPVSRSIYGNNFFDRARAVLTLDAPPGLTDPDALPLRGDHDADPVVKAIAAVRPIKPAAVLIPVIERDEPMVLLTQRTAHLPQHAGQIAFPGGKIDPTDETPLAAALREAQEEIGLDAGVIDPIGYLDIYMTTLGYRIVPVVARVHPQFTLTINPGEVEDTFEVPLSHLMEPANHQTHSREWQGMMRSYYAIPFGERYIWGVTAGIFRNLQQRIYGA